MKNAPRSIISAGDDDTAPAYLFYSRSDASVHAVTRHPTGGNLPGDHAPEGWSFDGMIALGVREAMPLKIAPEPVLRGLLADGYFIWREGSNPKGTSQ